MIVGEAPGHREDDSGVPFVGQAGQLLDETLNKAGLDRRRIFITNAVHCRPPENRTPKKGEIKTCHRWLDAEVAEVKPKFVLLLGNVPLISVTGKGGIKKHRGKPFELNGVLYLPTFHPSFILRDDRYRSYFERDIEYFVDIVEHGGIPQEKDLDFTIVTTEGQLLDMLGDIAADGEASFDIETTCLYPWQADAAINSIGFGTSSRQYLMEPTSARVATIDKFLRKHKIKLVCQNGKFDFLWMWVHYGVEWFPQFDFDTMLAHYLLDENDLHDLKYLAKRYFGAHDWDILAEEKTQALNPVVARYQAHDLYYTLKLKRYLAKKLADDKDIERLFHKLMMPLARLFVEIEYDGLYIDLDKMDAAERYLKKVMRQAEAKMKKYADINFASPKQLGVLLFDTLKLPVLEKTKKGARSTNESVLKRLDHPVVESILAFRGAKQQHSFFIEGWKPFLDGHYLHPSFKLHGTVTGRPSAEHPNIQQVPRDERIRQLIAAPPGWELIDADLSQVELRIAAMLASEHTMLAWFDEGKDIHWMVCLGEIERGGGYSELVIRTASKIAGKEVRYHEAFSILRDAGPDVCIDIDKAWKELRKKAKAIDFGFLYGMWWKKFLIYARDNYGLKLKPTEAKAARKFFFDTFSDLPAWHTRQRQFARRFGYVRTLTGRKRRLPDAQSPHDSPARGEAERQAINSPVQGFAAELNLMAALQLREEFPRSEVRMCATVHDSILVRAKNKVVARVTKRLLEIMSHPKLLDELGIKLTVPIEAEAKIGPWSLGVSLERWSGYKARNAA